MLPFDRPGRSASSSRPIIVNLGLRGGIEHTQADLACEVGAFKNAAALGKKKSQKQINHAPRSRRRAPQER